MKKFDPDLLCVECNRSQNDVIHCKDCCGWGITKDFVFHKFVPYEKTKCTKNKKKK